MNEYILGFIEICIFLSVISFAIYLRKQKRKGIVKSIPFKHIKGINQLAKGIDVTISFNENIVTVDSIMIPNSKISKVQISSSKQLVNRENNVIGRAIVGSIFGGVGSVVGGISGISDGSKVTKLMHFLTITFKNGNHVIFSFKNDSNISDLNGVIKKFNINKRTL